MKKCMWIIILCCLCVKSSYDLHICNGVIDRLEGDIAIILVERERLQVDVSVLDLPKGSSEGMFVNVKNINNEFVALHICKQTTMAEKKRSELLLEDLYKKKMHQ